jgi:hypothetical protein
MATRFHSRAHAVDALRNSYGGDLRDLADRGASLAELREALRRGIDLADLPADLAEEYAISNRAWRRFLGDIIRAARVNFAPREKALADVLSVACPTCDVPVRVMCQRTGQRYERVYTRGSGASTRDVQRKAPHKSRVAEAERVRRFPAQTANV